MITDAGHFSITALVPHNYCGGSINFDNLHMSAKRPLTGRRTEYSCSSSLWQWLILGHFGHDNKTVRKVAKNLLENETQR